MKLRGIQRNYLRAKLLEKGLTIREFAKKNGFKYGTVQKVLHRYLNNPDYKPRGKLAGKIVTRLSDYV